MRIIRSRSPSAPLAVRTKIGSASILGTTNFSLNSCVKLALGSHSVEFTVAASTRDASNLIEKKLLHREQVTDHSSSQHKYLDLGFQLVHYSNKRKVYNPSSVLLFEISRLWNLCSSFLILSISLHTKTRNTRRMVFLLGNAVSYFHDTVANKFTSISCPVAHVFVSSFQLLITGGQTRQQ